MSASHGTGIYERLGVRPVVNGIGTVTRLGGSLMPPEVLQAMLEGPGSTSPWKSCRRRGRHLAGLTRNEGAYVTSGAAGGAGLEHGRLRHRGRTRRRWPFSPTPSASPGGATRW